MQALPQALAPLGSYQQFILYKLVPKNDGSGKVDKLPVDPRTGRAFNYGSDWQNDPASMVDHAAAIHFADKMGPDYGVGFLFTQNDPFIFVDIDGALDAAGQWSPVAVDLCTRLQGAAVEVSQSGTGLHIIASAADVLPHRCKDPYKLGLELYHERRFVALTGHNTIGSAAFDVTWPLQSVISTYFPPAPVTESAEWTTVAREDYKGPENDDELIDKMLRSGGTAASVFGNKISFAQVWNRDIEALSRAYPDHYGNRPYDESEADLGLASRLAFWTGCNCERMMRLMWRSALIRDKWHHHKTYLKNTIIKAISGCTDVYGSKQAEQKPGEMSETQKIAQLPESASTLDIPFQAAAETLAVLSSRPARLIRFNETWLTRESGGYYREILDEVIRSEIRSFTPWQINPTKVNATVDEMRSALVVDAHGVELPHWLSECEGMPEAGDLIVCRNGILDPSTGMLYDHTDELLTFNALPFDYEPDAPQPSRWEAFLAEIFNNDLESIYELKKLFGYLITQDTSLQKIFAIIGPKRSGKGTIARILRELIGSKNTASPSFNRIGGDFGMQSLIGKQLAIFPDARVGRNTDKTIVAERLLSISGEDALDVGRKHVSDWHGKLNTRLLVLANEVPVFGDASGALASRYIVFHTPTSFYGREDQRLTDKLKEELPGILNWALEGLADLRRDGVINTPAGAEDLVDEIDSLGSPVKAFVKGNCEIGPGRTVAKDALWNAYRHWHVNSGLSGHPLSKEMFGRNLKTAYSGFVREFRPRMEDNTRPRYWDGVRLKNELADQVFSS